MKLRGLAGVGQLSRRWRASGLLVLGMTTLVALSFTGSAQATGESIYITPPSSANVGVSYSFTVSGYAPQTEQLYFFDDAESCGSSPYVEHAVHNANGDDYTVSGNFQYVSGGWKSPKATTYYVCAYLVDASEPSNPSAGVLAEKFQSFPVQSAGRSCSPGPHLSGTLSVRNTTCSTGRSVSDAYFFNTPPGHHVGAATFSGWHCSGRIIPVSQNFSKFGINCHKGIAQTTFVGDAR